ncbi:hypothetical protein BKA67DRAFT_647314 [Truncatella angustata]|uniref:Uncharacterized protein n=1 Tax=Truncatella angustata TaxID=152316 RepID=A0A9P8UJR4_9PEZI|nr:uncharacterized protein BKA67DRAFT_647314 [Truncatella angustata]KAH6653407.1 hypothetical protein BKA67DRAFT_647314 [Truncatella angustata]
MVSQDRGLSRSAGGNFNLPDDNICSKNAKRRKPQLACDGLPFAKYGTTGKDRVEEVSMGGDPEQMVSTAPSSHLPSIVRTSGGKPMDGPEMDMKRRLHDPCQDSASLAEPKPRSMPELEPELPARDCNTCGVDAGRLLQLTERALWWSGRSNQRLKRSINAEPRLTIVRRWGGPVDLDIQIYVDGIAQWVGANVQWSFESKRYFSKLGLEIKESRILELLPSKAEAQVETGPFVVNSLLSRGPDDIFPEVFEMLTKSTVDATSMLPERWHVQCSNIVCKEDHKAPEIASAMSTLIEVHYGYLRFGSENLVLTNSIGKTQQEQGCVWSIPIIVEEPETWTQPGPKE